MILLKLLHIICPFNFISKAAALDGEGIHQAKVTVDSKPSTVTLILLIAELAIFELEVSGHIIKNHRESPDDLIGPCLFSERTIAEDGILGRMGMDIEENLKSFLLCYFLLHEGSYHFYFG